MSAAVAEQKRDEAGVQTLPAETHISAHRILQEYDAEHRGLEALHTDIFDPRRPVALSALEALGALADPRSVPFILRFLANAKDELRCAGVRTLGKIHAPAVPRLLLDMARTAQGDALRREVLEALATAAPGDQEAVGLIRQAARTPMG
ncbi:MAG TPA: HEAT repeat domain-containing protein, partial [bacterium]|nr:HEAT repeat domain-containing protein [bacterium]